MEFEWDPNKNTHNKQKHGVLFDEAIVIWDGVHVEIKEVARSDDGEKRSATMGWIGNRLYVAIWTKRKRRIRLISVRRARTHEEKTFEEIQNRS